MKRAKKRATPKRGKGGQFVKRAPKPAPRPRKKKARKKHRALSGIDGVIVSGTHQSATKTKGRSSMPRKKKAHHKKAAKRPAHSSRKAKRSHSRKRRTHVTHQVRYFGLPHPKHSPIEMLMLGASAVVGAIAGSFVGGKIPAPEKLKPAIPIAAGIALPMIPKLGANPYLRAASLGMLAAGGLSYLRQFAPDVPLLTGEHTDLLGIPGDAALQGADDVAELMGIEAELQGMEELQGAEEQELLGAPAEFAGEDTMGAERSYVTSASL